MALEGGNRECKPRARGRVGCLLHILTFFLSSCCQRPVRRDGLPLLALPLPPFNIYCWVLGLCSGGRRLTPAPRGLPAEDDGEGDGAVILSPSVCRFPKVPLKGSPLTLR